MIWRSTKLGKIDRHCLAVVCFEGDLDRRIFEAGKVAHLIIEEAQRATNKAGLPLDVLDLRAVALAATTSACEHGFSFEGKPEPPPRPGNADRGRRLAERWLIDNPPEPGMQAEVAVTLDRWGQMVKADDPKAWARVLIDRVGLKEIVTDDETMTVLAVDDHKTDWQSGRGKDEEGEEIVLTNAQRRLQALGAWALHLDDDFSAMVLAVNSLPRMWTFRKVIRGAEMGILDEWREELLAITDGYDKRITRYGLDPEKLASPGAGCFGCPHLRECSAAHKHLGRDETMGDEEAATAYAAHIAEANRLRDYLAPLCDLVGHVTSGDTIVGYDERAETVVAKNAAEIVWREWKRQFREGVDDEQDAFERDLLQRYLDGVKLSSTTLTKLLAKLWPLNRGSQSEKDAKRVIRDRIMSEATQIRLKPVFGVRKVKPSVEDQLRASLEVDNEPAAAKS